jgi:hypothetical protein
MFAIKPECGIIMIEFRCFPVFSIMTIGAFRDPVFIKLPEMIVGMTIGTVFWQSREFLPDISIRILSEMTDPARLPGMCAVKNKTCNRMVKGNI